MRGKGRLSMYVCVWWGRNSRLGKDNDMFWCGLKAERSMPFVPGRFDFDLSLEEATQRRLELSVKHSVSFMSREKELMGKVRKTCFSTERRTHSLALLSNTFLSVLQIPQILTWTELLSPLVFLFFLLFFSCSCSSIWTKLTLTLGSPNGMYTSDAHACFYNIQSICANRTSCCYLCSVLLFRYDLAEEPHWWLSKRTWWCLEKSLPAPVSAVPWASAACC